MVEIVQLGVAALQALADGDRDAAEAASPVPLGDYVVGGEHRWLWRYRYDQVTADPAAAGWVTGVVWDPERAVAVGRAGFHGPPDDAGMVEVGYAIDPAYRRQGYARAALECLLDRAAREPAVRVVRASVAPANVASRALVDQHGFVPVGERWDEQDGPETVLEVPVRRTRIRAVVLHQTRPWVLRDTPEVELSGPFLRVQAPAVVTGFRDQHGLDLAVLDAPGTGDLLAVLRGPEPAGASWVEPVGATAELVRLATGPGERPRQPWLRRDWLPTVTAWLESTVDLTGPVRQHKVWDLSCVLRADTTAGPVYIKAIANAPLFAPEAAVTVALARLFPDQVPEPVAADLDRGWLALADFGPELGWDAPVDVRAEMLRRWARLQQASAGQLDPLRAAGCRDRGLAWLAGAIPEWFAADGLRPYVPAEVADRLVAAVPRLVALCAGLAVYGLPDTLQHGDLHMANVAAGYRFFDWTDAAIGPPFVDAVAVLLAEDAAVEATLRDAYLSPWPAAAATAWPIAAALGAVNQSISYMSLGSFLARGSTGIFASFTGRWLQMVLDRLPAAEERMAAWPP